MQSHLLSVAGGKGLDSFEDRQWSWDVGEAQVAVEPRGIQARWRCRLTKEAGVRGEPESVVAARCEDPVKAKGVGLEGNCGIRGGAPRIRGRHRDRAARGLDVA